MTRARTFPQSFAAACVVAGLALTLGGAAVAQGYGGAAPQVIDEGATMADRLGAAADLNVRLTAASGETLVLEDLLTGERPILVNLGYSNCPGMCDVILDTLLRTLDEAGVEPGRDVELWTISIDHEEPLERLVQRRDRYLDHLAEQSGTGTPPAWTRAWRFFIGEQAEVHRLATSVGWRYYRDLNEYDHPPTVVLLSPTGTTTRYLDYRTMNGQTLRRAVVEASNGKVGSFVERLLISCLTFDPTTGRYSVTAMTVMQIGGALTVVALTFMILTLLRRERRRREASTPATT